MTLERWSCDCLDGGLRRRPKQLHSVCASAEARTSRLRGRARVARCRPSTQRGTYMFSRCAEPDRRVVGCAAGREVHLPQGRSRSSRQSTSRAMSRCNRPAGTRWCRKWSTSTPSRRLDRPHNTAPRRQILAGSNLVPRTGLRRVVPPADPQALRSALADALYGRVTFGPETAEALRGYCSPNAVGERLDSIYRSLVDGATAS